jgi:hypothetical protein
MVPQGILMPWDVRGFRLNALATEVESPIPKRREQILWLPPAAH